MPFDRDGGPAEYVVVPSGVVPSKPKTLDHIQSAAIPLAGLSAWQALFDHGGLQRGERVMVTGARGGVGHFAVQLARWAGAEVVDGGEADLVFDTTGPAAIPGIRAGRIVSVAREAPGVTCFIVEPNPRPARRARTACRRGRNSAGDRLRVPARRCSGGVRPRGRAAQARQGRAPRRRQLGDRAVHLEELRILAVHVHAVEAGEALWLRLLSQPASEAGRLRERDAGSRTGRRSPPAGVRVAYALAAGG